MNSHRILIIDDNPAIHTDFRKILCPASTTADVDSLEASLFGGDGVAVERPVFEIASALQGQEGFEMVKQAAAEGRPFALAFVDGRMPPGWDGVETIVHIWKAHPGLQIVICTAYSDYSWEQIIARVGLTDSLIILKKPFDTVEVQQLAHAMTRKWTLNQQARLQMDTLNHLVLEKTKEMNLTKETAEASREMLTGALESAQQVAARAEAANKARNEFLATMNHEIRAPLNGVLNMSSALLQTSLDADQRDCAETIKLSGEALLNILGNILDFSKIEAGRLTLEKIEFNPAVVIREAVSLVENDAAAKGLQVTASLDPAVPVTLLGDPARLRQVVLNILSNGIKFTESGGVRVHLLQTADTRTHATLGFEICDTGIGIAPGTQQNLFAPFALGSSGPLNRRMGGTGLGLVICRRLVELMGGQIGVVSQLGRGSTFRFTIHLEKPRSAALSSGATQCA